MKAHNIEFEVPTWKEGGREKVTKITGDGSITPTTHKYDKTVLSKGFDLNTEAMGDKITIPAEAIFRTEYQYKESKTSKVTRFGINTKNEDVAKYVKDFNQEVHTLEQSATPSKFASQLGKKPEALKGYQDYIEYAKKNITDVEKFLVKAAKENLSTNKTVLIDVFVRDAEGKINVSEGRIETHTVVLYKQVDKYLVIDPSNTTFSTILRGSGNDIVCCFDKELQIYKPGSKDISTNFNQWRDCIDIAVKLAFNINHDLPVIDTKDMGESLLILEKNTIQASPFSKEVSNNPSLYQPLPSELKFYPTRAKQSSDVSEQKIITAILKAFSSINKQISIKLAELDFTGVKSKVSELVKKCFEKTTDEHSVFSKSLKILITEELYPYSDKSSADQTIHLLGFEENCINEMFVGD